MTTSLLAVLQFSHIIFAKLFPDAKQNGFYNERLSKEKQKGEKKIINISAWVSEG